MHKILHYSTTSTCTHTQIGQMTFTKLSSHCCYSFIPLTIKFISVSMRYISRQHMQNLAFWKWF